VAAPFSAWPPTRHEFLRESTPHRPIFQGDIFQGVPNIKAQAGDRPDADPKVRIERRPAMALAYPCEMYARGVLARLQTIAVVREGSKLGIPDDWRGAFGACPLPDLFGDRVLWAVDFRTTSSVDRSYLTEADRVATLTELGWAYLRQRLALYFARVTTHLEDLQQAGRATWDETELWEHWTALGRPSSEFQAWLDLPDPNIGFTRRQALERGMRHLVASTLVGPR
jgi:hypothetical protein